MMGRKEDLEQKIRNSYALIQEYEVILQISSNPKEKIRARRDIGEQWDLIRGWQDEYLKLCLSLGEPVRSDIAEITARFSPVPITAEHHSLFGLPPLPKGFVGREAETSSLLAALEDPEITIIWIGGISGIGKTYLAAWLYQQVGDHQGYQPLWVDCRPRSVTLEVLLDALTEVSNNLELAQLMQDPAVSLAERVGQVVQRYVEPMRLVLFLDDYHRLEGLEERYRLDEFVIQVASRCQRAKLFLIGRVRPKVLDDPRLRGAILAYPVGGLAEEHTREYVEIPDLTDKQARRVWEKCGRGTPIAMSLFSTAVQWWQLSELLRLPIWDIAETRSQWLDLIVEALTPLELGCIRAASVFPAHIPIEALSCVYGGNDLHVAVTGLQRKGLLDHEPGSDCCRVRHDIIREYISEKKTSSAARNEMERRLAKYYAQFVLENLHDPQRLQSESANTLGGLDWCRRKRYGASVSITALFQLLLDLEERPALQITYSIGELANRSGDAKWAEELYNEVSDLARVKGHQAELARALGQLAHLANYEGSRQLAIARLEEAIEIGRSAGEAARDTIATSCNLLGELLVAQGRNRYTLAEQYLMEGLQAAKECKDSRTAVSLVGKLVYLYRDQHEFEKAYALYQQEREKLSGTSLAILLTGIVPGLIDMGSFDEAWHRIQEARGIFEETNNIGGMAFTWRLQGSWHWGQDELELAEESFQKEERLRRSAGEEEKGFLLQALWEQHWFFLTTGQLSKAEQCRAKYQRIQTEPDWIIPQMLGREATVLLAQEAYQGASQRCNKALAIYEEQGNIGGCAWIRRIQGDILAAQGKPEEAVRQYEEGLELRNCWDEPRYTAEDLEHLANFYLHEMDDVDQAQRYLRLARQEYQLFDTQKASAVDDRLRALE